MEVLMATSSGQAQKNLNIAMRTILGDAYSFVRGREYNETIANIDYDTLLDAAIDRIEGTEGRTEVRATKLDMIKKIKEEVETAIDTVKALPPESWSLETTKDDNQNTEEDEDEG
jgi:hypothetical protein